MLVTSCFTVVLPFLSFRFGSFLVGWILLANRFIRGGSGMCCVSSVCLGTSLLAFVLAGKFGQAPGVGTSDGSQSLALGIS